MNYTIEFLASNGVKRIYVLCKSHVDALDAHIKSLKGKIGVEVSCEPVVRSSNLGEALSEFADRDLIEQDFVFVYGDVISNQKLIPIIQQHVLRREKDKNVLMTLLLSKAVEDQALAKLKIPLLNSLFNAGTTSVSSSTLVTPHVSTSVPIDDSSSDLNDSRASRSSVSSSIVSSSPHTGSWMEAALGHGADKPSASNSSTSVAQAPRLRDSPLYLTLTSNESKVVVLDDETGEVFLYEERSSSHTGKHIEFDTALFRKHRFVAVRNDLQDSGVAVCSPEVLSKFKDDFDYRSMSQMIRGVINNELHDLKIFAALADEHSYTNRVSSLRRYHQVTGDVLKRWVFPLVPDTNVMPGSSWAYTRPGVYKEASVHLHRDCKVFPTCAIGERSSLASGVVCAQSTIGRHCQIGRNVKISHSFIWDNVVIEDDVTLEYAIVCSGARISKGAVIAPGSIVSYNVVVGPGVVLPPLTKLTAFGLVSGQSTRLSKRLEDEDFGESYSDDEDEGSTNVKSSIQAIDLGSGGVGGKWTPPALPFNELYAGWENISHLREILAAMQRTLKGVDARDAKKGAAAAIIGEPEEVEEPVTDMEAFGREVASIVEIFASDTNKDLKQLTLEINSLKFAHDRSFLDCINAVFAALLKLADPNALLKSLLTYIKRFKPIFGDFLFSAEDKKEFLFALEEFCEKEEHAQFAKQFTNILNQLYDQEILPEDTFLDWAAEHEEDEEEDDAEESPLYNGAKKFIDWLKEDDEEEEEDEEDDDEEDDE